MPAPAANLLPYTLSLPTRQSAALVFGSPHSGADYPRVFTEASVLDEIALRSSEDAYVDRLLAGVAEHGAPLLAARYPRAYVDLNRAETELDPAVIHGLGRGVRSARVAAGLGVIPRVVSGGRAIYRGKMPLAEAEARIAAIWRPYHARLDRLLAETRAQFGRAVLIDVHSMPSEALSGLGAARPEIVLGDRHGKAASPAVTAAVAEAFRQEGFRVALNAPFAGAFISERYGLPEANRHVVQVEIDRSLYMEEASLRPRADFAQFVHRIDRVAARLCRAATPGQQLAAE
ncbi:N-formylglutamate amidohydrolase [Pseudothioclava arenosa]|uniref:N-formylglutamate amidohydrolase n=1 Tax=Pseudothioclava arenosa TaxID=1795308 RepID=A0A2A4CQB2_9RHOB|nr:N-formylglutamate amidohydrolase [Pseudothioclava arenosa]PCD76306.1 N-formylglutamate amidohydrolase [Pseudothioclava arenosa]